MTRGRKIGEKLLFNETKLVLAAKLKVFWARDNCYASQVNKLV